MAFLHQQCDSQESSLSYVRMADTSDISMCLLFFNLIYYNGWDSVCDFITATPCLVSAFQRLQFSNMFWLNLYFYITGRSPTPGSGFFQTSPRSIPLPAFCCRSQYNYKKRSHIHASTCEFIGYYMHTELNTPIRNHTTNHILLQSEFSSSYQTDYQEHTPSVPSRHPLKIHIQTVSHLTSVIFKKTVD